MTFRSHGLRAGLVAKSERQHSSKYSSGYGLNEALGENPSTPTILGSS